MKTYFKLALIFLTLIHMPLAGAHAVVTDYSLKMHPIHAHKADNIIMSFNSQVEIGLSQVFLVSKGDAHELLNISAGQKQGQLIVEVPALEPGDYAIKFKVFAADGHLTEDVIHFSVAE